MDYTLQALAEHLGIGDNDEELMKFVDSQEPLQPDTPLIEAPFWNVSQIAMLTDALRSDDSWSIAVVQLDALLREDGDDEAADAQHSAYPDDGLWPLKEADKSSIDVETQRTLGEKARFSDQS